MPRHAALAAGKVADAPSGDLAHERFYGRKEGILTHRMRADPTVVPLGNVVIGTRSHRLPPIAVRAIGFTTFIARSTLGGPPQPGRGCAGSGRRAPVPGAPGARSGYPRPGCG